MAREQDVSADLARQVMGIDPAEFQQATSASAAAAQVAEVRSHDGEATSVGDQVLTPQIGERAPSLGGALSPAGRPSNLSPLSGFDGPSLLPGSRPLGGRTEGPESLVDRDSTAPTSPAGGLEAVLPAVGFSLGARARAAPPTSPVGRRSLEEVLEFWGIEEDPYEDNMQGATCCGAHGRVFAGQRDLRKPAGNVGFLLIGRVRRVGGVSGRTLQRWSSRDSRAGRGIYVYSG